jgi:cold shock CspA family protein
VSERHEAAAAFSEQRGRVERFDERRGEGEIRAPDGRCYRFHATRIADGTRRIAAGTEVVFVVLPGPAGTWEAGAVRRLG